MDGAALAPFPLPPWPCCLVQEEFYGAPCSPPPLDARVMGMDDQQVRDLFCWTARATGSLDAVGADQTLLIELPMGELDMPGRPLPLPPRARPRLLP